MASQYTNQSSGNITVGGTPFNFTSNAVTAELFDLASVTMTKTQSAAIVVHGQTVTYTIAIVNLTLAILNNFAFSDAVPIGMTYTPGTFKVNAVTQTPTIAGQNLSYNIALLAIGLTTITFDVTVN